MVNELKEVLSYNMYMWNTWNPDECALLFNKPGQEWKYSLGEHIWNRWMEFNNKNGLGAPALFVSYLDENNLDKVIKRACELYYGREKKNINN